MTVFELGGADRVPNFSEQLWINGYIGGKQILDVKIAFFFNLIFSVYLEYYSQYFSEMCYYKKPSSPKKKDTVLEKTNLDYCIGSA